MHEVFILDEDGASRSLPSPEGVVVLTQCCDLARGGTGEAQVAVVVRLDGADAKNAASGRTSRYAELPLLGDDMFADLGQVGGSTHSVIITSPRVPAVADDDRHLLGERISRRFGRFAYPDEVQPLLSWIRDKIRSKARSAQSPLGQLLDRVQTIRIENEYGWNTDSPWSVVMVLVLKEGELPSLDLDEPPESYLQGSVNTLASQIANCDPGVDALAGYWSAFCNAFTEEAISQLGGLPVDVSSFTVEAVEAGDYSYSRYLRSAALDVDDLSDAG